MENEKLYYEKKPISKPIDVKNAYEYVVANNIKYYRCVSGKGDFYGWDGHLHIKAPAGVEWFENPNYTAPLETNMADETAIVTAETTENEVTNSCREEIANFSEPLESEKEHKSALELLREKMAEKTAMIEAANAQIADGRAEIEKLGFENSQLQSELEAKTTECDNLRADNERMAAKCAEFEEIVNSIELL